MRIAICDDDPKASNSLYQDITKIAEEQLNTPQNTEPSLDPVMTRSDIFADPDELLFAAESEHYDLAFIDIELGDQSGIRLSNHLLRIHPDIQIIFFSGYDDYYLDVYNVDHVYFLKKPVDPERLKTALYAAQRKVLSLKDKFLTISNKQGVFRIPLQEILFLEKSRRLILVHTADGEVFKTYGKFSDFEDSLDSLFFQCGDSRFGICFDRIGDGQISSIVTFHSNQNLGSEYIIFVSREVDTVMFHELSVATENYISINNGQNSLACDFF